MKNNCVVIVDDVNQWNQFETDTIATNGEMTKDIVPYFKNEDNEGFDDDEICEIKDALSKQNDVSVLIKRDLDGKYFALSYNGEMSVQDFLDEAETRRHMIKRALTLIGGSNIRVTVSAEAERADTVKVEGGGAGRCSVNEGDGGETGKLFGSGGVEFAKVNQDQGNVYGDSGGESAKPRLDEAREYIRKYRWLQESEVGDILDGVEKRAISGPQYGKYVISLERTKQLKGIIDVMFKYSIIDAKIKAKLEGEVQVRERIEQTLSFEITLPKQQ